MEDVVPLGQSFNGLLYLDMCRMLGNGESLTTEIGWDVIGWKGRLGRGKKLASEAVSSGGSVQRKIPAVLRKHFLLWSPGRETRQAGQRAVGGRQGLSLIHVETSQAWQLGGCALHTAEGCNTPPMLCGGGPGLPGGARP